MLCDFLDTLYIKYGMMYKQITFSLSFVGAFSCLTYKMVLPCLVQLKSLQQEGKLSVLAVVGHVPLMLIAGANFVMQFMIDGYF